jgi:Tfp pilus assembly protein PilO
MSKRKRKGKDGQPSQRRAVAAVVACCLLVAAGGWFLLVKPQQSQAKSLDQQIVDVQGQIEQRQAAIAAAAHHSDQIRTADLFRLTKAMPDRADMPDILLELSRVAGATGIQFKSITPQAATLLSGYQVVPIDLIFQGNYYDLADFVYRLRNLVSVHQGRLTATGRLFSVDSIDFSEGEQKFPQILATVTVDAFVYGSTPATGAAGAPSTLAPAPTSGTGTTSSTDTTSTDTTATDTTQTPTVPPVVSANAAGVTP